MDYFRINGGRRLGGEISLHGAKNSVLPILAATVIVKGECVIHNCPRLSDVEVTLRILEHLGARVKRENATVTVNALNADRYDVPQKLMQEMRSSIIFLGALTSRFKRASVSLPGGCEIGQRPIDMHIGAMRQLGYTISFSESEVCSLCGNAGSGRVELPFPSVGATENIILSAVLLDGTTTVINAAREPEIVDLCNFLIKAGARIYGAGTPIIEIEGVNELHPTQYSVMPDRILATTLMSAAAITSSEIRINKAALSDLVPVFPVFNEAGCKIYLDKNALTVKAPKRLKRVRNIETKPYPGFPTDCQAPVCAMLSVARGRSVINETIFENRYLHVPQLKLFGADITVKDRIAVINGVKTLHPAKARCTDLRGGAAVVIAALAAEGESYITSLKHIDRGYEDFEKQLSSIGADIVRIKDEKES